MIFGMQNNCFQYTYEVPSLYNACFTYDSLAVLSPLLLAVTSSTPIQKGEFCNWENRFDLIGDSVDSNINSDKLKYMRENNLLWDDMKDGNMTYTQDYKHRKRYSSIPM